MSEKLKERDGRMPATLGRLLCLVGAHDFRVLEVRFGFGQGNCIEKVECRRCGIVSTRRS